MITDIPQDQIAERWRMAYAEAQRAFHLLHPAVPGGSEPLTSKGYMRRQATSEIAAACSVVLLNLDTNPYGVCLLSGGNSMMLPDFYWWTGTASSLETAIQVALRQAKGRRPFASWSVIATSDRTA